jgi:hypothetical protein
MILRSCIINENMRSIMLKATGSILLLFVSLVLWAQEKGLDVDIDVNKKESNWYQQPWVWIVGGAVFVLLLVAILKGSGGKKD